MLRRPRTTKLLTIIAVLAVAAWRRRGGDAHICFSLDGGAASAGRTAAADRHRCSLSPKP